MKKAGITSFHEKFDEETLLKLKLFRAYVRKWLPVFLSQRTFPQINIFDFFAGPGSDADGNPGSPQIILDEAANYFSNIKIDREIRLNLYFNDKDKKKTEQLKELVERFRKNYNWQIDVRNLDFVLAYSECLPRIRDKYSANLDNSRPVWIQVYAT